MKEFGFLISSAKTRRNIYSIHIVYILQREYIRIIIIIIATCVTTKEQYHICAKATEYAYNISLTELGHYVTEGNVTEKCGLTQNY